METFDDLVLGEPAEPIALTTRQEHREASAVLARQAQRNVEIVSRHLDPAIYDQGAFLEAIKRLVMGHRRARARIIVQDIGPVITHGHRLASLAMRLSSFLQIRVPAPQFKDFNQAFLVVDGTGFIHRELADRYEGTAHFNNRGGARDLLRTFDEMWEVAELHPDLREMRI